LHGEVVLTQPVLAMPALRELGANDDHGGSAMDTRKGAAEDQLTDKAIAW
jgi:hypothetical protein